MQTKLEQAKYDYFEDLYFDTIEHPIDIEYSLPDYCPDIQKILKCHASAQISSYSFTQEKIICEGSICLYIQYIDEKTGCIRVCEINKEYSSVKDISYSGEKYTGKITATTGHIVCRAINARKLDIHVPILLNVKITAQKSEMIAYAAQGLETKMETLMATSAVNQVAKQFVLEEEFNLSQGNPPIESIMRRSVSVSQVRASSQDGKVLIEGSIDVNIVYRTFSETQSVEKLSYTMPFSQSIDVAGVQSECISNIDMEVGEFIIQVKEDSMGEYTICQFFIKMFSVISVYKKSEIAVISDAYTTKYESQMKFSNICFLNLEDDSKEKIMQKKSIFLADDEIEKLLDIWCENVSVTPFNEKNKVNFRVKYDVSLIYMGKSKQTYFVTKSFDFNMSREFNDIVQRKSEAKVKLDIRDFRIVDANNIDINCEATAQINIFAEQNKKILTEAIVSDKINEDNFGKVCVYYSLKGEELWDIGKKYKASLKTISEINNLSDDSFSAGGALVIF